MWCSRCNKETASVPSRAADGVCCALCGENYYREKPSDETIREAREIIAKWSSSDLLDQISTLPQIPALSDRHNAASSMTESSPKESATANELSQQPERTVSTEPPTARRVEPQLPEPIVTEPQSVQQSDVASPTNHPNLPPVTTTSPRPSSPPKPKTRLEISATRPKTTPPAEVVEDSKQTDPQPRKMVRRKTQARQQRQNAKPEAATDQGMKPMSRKLRVDSPGADQPELPDEPSTNVAGGRIQSNSTSGSRRRIDSGESNSNVLNTADRRTRTQSRPRQRYIDDAHDAAARGPHFEVVPQRRSNLTSVTGQFLAYLGVLGLTIGTAMVIYGHFGGYSQYTPTGWLVTTVAQMMLFLGVINLVSGGMEQTNNDVSQRMEYLGAQLMRIEQVTEEAIRGPKIPADRYANPEAAVEDNHRTHASIRQD